MSERIRIENLGPIKKADVRLGDLTILVGPQASGKSLFVQTYKAIRDASAIRRDFKNYGFDWKRKTAVHDFCSAYFGGGLGNLVASNTLIKRDATKVSMSAIALPHGGAEESVYLIPAQRVQVLQDGWPRPFMSYQVSDPYCIKHFSETVRLLMERDLNRAKSIFPQAQRLKADLRALLDESIYIGGTLNIEMQGTRKRIVLRQGESALATGAWSAGQREFTPLLFGLLWLMPPSKISKREEIETVIIEEPEMGLHPQAIMGFGLLVFELMSRGYKVIVSTHSPVLLDLVWATQELRGVSTKKALIAFRKIFDLERLSPPIRQVLSAALTKEFRTYFFKRGDDGVETMDISTLDPGDEDENVSGWGGLSGFSGNTADAVGEALAQ